MPASEADENARDDSRSLYTPAFWLVFAGNAGLLVANTLDCRFAQLVADRGGSDRTAGLLVGGGVLALIALRGVLGAQLDKRGVRAVWIACGGLYAAGCLALPFCPNVYWMALARAVLTIGFGGAITCAVAAAQQLSPERRRTEAMTVLGIGGALGIVVGAAAGDYVDLLGGGKFYWLYGGAAALAGVGVGAAAVGCGGLQSEQKADGPGLRALAVRYWPGAPLLAISVKGVVLAVTTVHLARFVERNSLGGLLWFFLAVAASGALVRWLGKDWGDRFGRHRLVLVGLAGCAGMLASFPLCAADWHLALPGVLGGAGQSLLAPAAISLGAGRFPRKFRGAGTSVMHAAVDGGLVLAAPLLAFVGGLGGSAVSGDALLFGSAAAVAAAAAAFYWLTVGNAADETEDSAAEHTARRRARRAKRRAKLRAKGRVPAPRGSRVELGGLAGA